MAKNLQLIGEESRFFDASLFLHGRSRAAGIRSFFCLSVLFLLFLEATIVPVVVFICRVLAVVDCLEPSSTLGPLGSVIYCLFTAPSRRSHLRVPNWRWHWGGRRANVMPTGFGVFRLCRSPIYRLLPLSSILVRHYSNYLFPSKYFFPPYRGKGVM